jgi:hypothetical protein
MVRVRASVGMSATRGRSTKAANSGTGMRLMDPSVLGRGLAMGTSAFALHNGPGDAGDHPGLQVLDVARAEREHLPGTHGGSEEDLEDVADLAVGLGARETGPASPPSGCFPDRGDLVEGERLRCRLDSSELQRSFDRVARDGVVTQRVVEQHVEQGPGLLGLRRRDLGLLGQEPLHPAGGHLGERVVLERRADMEPQAGPVALLGVFGEVAQVEVGKAEVGEIREGAGRV